MNEEDKPQEAEEVKVIQESLGWSLMSVEPCSPTEPIPTMLVFSAGQGEVRLSCDQARKLANKLIYELAAQGKYCVMKAGGKYTLHDTTDEAKREEEKTADVIGDNIDLEIKVQQLEATVKKLKGALDLIMETVKLFTETAPKVSGPMSEAIGALVKKWLDPEKIKKVMEEEESQ